MVLAELATLIAASGLGLTSGTNLFYGILPPDPDVLLTMFEYGGQPNEPNLGRGTTRLVFPRVQVLARGIKDDYDGPRLVLQNIVTLFTAVVNQNVTGIRYLAIEPLQDPFPLRRDDNFRIEIVCNFKITKEYSST